MHIDQRAVMLCSLGVKAGMARVWCTDYLSVSQMFNYYQRNVMSTTVQDQIPYLHSPQVLCELSYEINVPLTVIFNSSLKIK